MFVMLHIDCKGTKTDGKTQSFLCLFKIESNHIPFSQKLILRFIHFKFYWSARKECSIFFYTFAGRYNKDRYGYQGNIE